MTEIRNPDGTTTRVDNNQPYVEPRRSNGGTMIAVVLIAIVAIVGVLFATGFWSASVKGGNLPTVSVKGGDLPDVNVKSKEIVVGTTKTSVTVPKLETKKTTIDVPTVGVKDDK
ncbi:hypothetical protein [Sphingomonas sp. SUN039]|uniref:hypothetical protein n=1 Tax=Sphingomonas sp. SUN039 TaxID=2937787 RepID=UPI002164E130|nr:hypothetical protein [Sphingomonas sp. SUN039]UVO52707.1 hypothetical protein M0209_00665 [Sphingomonas sp. SUN039]